MVGSISTRPNQSSTSAGVDGSGDAVDQDPAQRDRRKRGKLRAYPVRERAWARAQKAAYPRPQSLCHARPAHQGGPARGGVAEQREGAERGPDRCRRPPTVRPLSERGGDHAQRIQTAPRHVGGHHEHHGVAREAHVSPRQDLSQLRPTSDLYDHGPSSQTVAVQHQAGAYRPARGTAARAVSGTRHGD